MNDDDTISPALARELVLGLGDATSHDKATHLKHMDATIAKLRGTLLMTGILMSCLCGLQRIGE